MGLVGVELVYYRTQVKGSAFNTTRGKGIVGGHCHRGNDGSGECSSRLHTVV